MKKNEARSCVSDGCRASARRIGAQRRSCRAPMCARADLRKRFAQEPMCAGERVRVCIEHPAQENGSQHAARRKSASGNVLLGTEPAGNRTGGDIDRFVVRHGRIHTAKSTQRNPQNGIRRTRELHGSLWLDQRRVRTAEPPRAPPNLERHRAAGLCGSRGSGRWSSTRWDRRTPSSAGSTAAGHRFDQRPFEEK